MPLWVWVLIAVGALGIGLGLWLHRPGGTYTPPADTTPAITSSSITGTPEDGETLTAQRTATGYPSPSFTYQWQASGTNIGGQTAQTIVLDAAGMGLTNGETISCEITATNTEGSDTDEPTIAFVVPADVTAPTITSGNPSGTFSEGVPIGGTLTANEAVTWSKSGTDAALVTLNTSTGVWSIPTTDFETKASYSWTFTATDGASNATNQVVFITISDVVEGTTPNTPVQSNLSSDWTAGDNPPRADVAYDGLYYDPDSEEGDSLRVRWKRLEADAWTTEAWVPFDLDLVLPYADGGGFRYAYLTDGTLFAAGRYEQQVQAVRDLGLVTEAFSAWSNSWIDTLDAGGETASSWATVTGADKSQYVTVNGTGNLVANGQGGFNSAPISVRSTAARSGKRQLQDTITAIDSAVWVGVNDGTDNLNDNFSVPGLSNSSGASLIFTPSYFAIYSEGAFVEDSGAMTFVVTDIITRKFDTDAGTLSFYRTRSGTTVQIGATVTGLGFTSLFAHVGFEGATTLTTLFGPGQTRALDSGYVPFDDL